VKKKTTVGDSKRKKLEEGELKNIEE